jgi:hypothetical protein
MVVDTTIFVEGGEESMGIVDPCQQAHVSMYGGSVSALSNLLRRAP